jgi:hypothetical protein
LPLSPLPEATDDPLIDAARETYDALGGDVAVEADDGKTPDDRLAFESVNLGRPNRYQPPLNVRAMS